MDGSPGQSGQEGDVASVEEMTRGTLGSVAFCVYADDGDELAESAGIPTITHPTNTTTNDTHPLTHSSSTTFLFSFVRSPFPTVHAPQARHQAIQVTHPLLA